MKKYTLLLEEEQHRYLRKVAADLGWSIKETLLNGAEEMARKHGANLNLDATQTEDKNGREQTGEN
jgi:hypothetical protein